MYSAIASSSSIASVGVVGAVIAASIDAMSDSRDAGVKLAPSRREAHGEKPARERRVHLFATGAHARSAGGGRFTAVRNEAPGGRPDRKQSYKYRNLGRPPHESATRTSPHTVHVPLCRTAHSPPARRLSLSLSLSLSLITSLLLLERGDHGGAQCSVFSLSHTLSLSPSLSLSLSVCRGA